MKRIRDSKRKIWIGSHAHIGLFIYDEETQNGIDDKKIRIFKIKQNTSSTFLKTTFKTGISDIAINVDGVVLEHINNYEKLWQNTRVTHCYSCKHHLSSMDFSVCKKCGWITCRCGACGCGFIRYN